MIIAVDFDGILCENEFPAIGKPHYRIIYQIRQLIDLGVEVILWTSRADGRLEEAVVWCEDYGLHFAAVNENAPSNIEQFKAEHPNGTRKVYADYYIDDHNLEFTRKRGKEEALHSVVAGIQELINKAVLRQEVNELCQEEN